MAATVWLLDAGTLRDSGKNTVYRVSFGSKGDKNLSNVRSAIIAHADYFASITTGSGYLLNVQEWTYDNKTKGKYKVTIAYSHKENKRNKNQNPPLQNVGDEETEITFSNEEVPVMESLGTQTKFGNSPDIGNRIEYNPKTGEVKGTTKKQRVSFITISKLYSNATVTNAWLKDREDFLFTLNLATFRDREAETVQFVGLKLVQRDVGGDWKVVFNFISAPKTTKDLTTLDIGSAVTNQAIFPFRYYHGLYEEEEDATAKQLVPKCIGFYEAKLYEAISWTNIIP